jgi:hypothetical protein
MPLKGDLSLPADISARLRFFRSGLQLITWPLRPSAVKISLGAAVQLPSTPQAATMLPMRFHA